MNVGTNLREREAHRAAGDAGERGLDAPWDASDGLEARKVAAEGVVAPGQRGFERRGDETRDDAESKVERQLH